MTGSSHNRRPRQSARAAKQWPTIAVLVGLWAACGNKPDQVPAASPYAADIEKLCNVVKLSGAETHESNDRIYLVATWLGTNLSTAEARKFLAEIQPLAGAAKGDALDAEAKRVGLATCALSAEWRK